ncbi:Nucleotidyltransferase [Bradyrhizobium sp. Gha]|nr:Nucleotidyltransferase [Bradyrhizobium sp. Gha]
MIAYQAYGAMLGVRLSAGSLQTGDVDIAQFKNVSVAVQDSTPPVLDVPKEVDKSFRAVPHVSDGRRVTRCAAKGGLRVDFLTPHERNETSRTQKLPALNTDAQPLRSWIS